MTAAEGSASRIGVQGAEYARHGWRLVLLPPKSKGQPGMRTGWNLRENVVSDPAVVACHPGNIGLALAFSGVVSIDIDALDGARAWFAQHGIDLDSLRNAPNAVHIASGVEGRDKLMFAVPDGVDAGALLTHRIADANRVVILELRCAAQDGKTMQDVLPPSIHPKTGRPYAWAGGGDWRNLPDLPSDLLALWESLHVGPRARRAHSQPLGDGTGPAMTEMFERLQGHGCKPFHCGHSIRAHCPVHFGDSGTTLKVDEAADGRLLVFCHAGTCSFAEILVALDMGPGPEVRIGRKPDARATTSEGGQAADDVLPASEPLPPLPASLCALPGLLGETQRWIARTMYRPHDGVAGLVALALVYYLAMPFVRIASRDGLGMGEFFQVLAPTGFGKESLRAPFRKLAKWAASQRMIQPDLHYNAPSSQQGLQEMLAANRCLVVIPDEFGEWIAKGEKEPHREQCMGHLMHVYGNPNGTVETPRAVTNKLPPVNEPRVLLFATSTERRFMEAMSGSIAERGFLNRFLTLPVGSESLEIGPLNNDPSVYCIPDALKTIAANILEAGALVTFDADAAAYSDAHLRAVLGPLQLNDNRLAGRLNEQAIRIAAAIVISEGRNVIDVRAMAMAYEIREGLYERTAAMFADDGCLNDVHPSAQALEQIRGLLKKHDSLKLSDLQRRSRKYAALSLNERATVVRTAQVERLARLEDGRLHSLIR